MPFDFGIGMFAYNMIALCVGAIIVYLVINHEK